MREVEKLRLEPLRVELVQSLKDLEKYAVQWDELLSRSGPNSPMHSYAWISAYLEHRFNADRTWYCLMVREGERLVGVLPLERDSHRSSEGDGVRLHSLADSHLWHADAVFETGREDEVLSQLLHFANHHFAGWWQLLMRRIPSSSPMLRARRHGIERILVICKQHGMHSYLDVKSDFQKYFEGLSTNFRRSLSKARNRLDRLGETKVELVSAGNSTDEELRRFMKVEASGWKGELGSAIRESEALTSYYATLTQRLAQSGLLEWHFLTLNGETIAGHMATRLAGRLTLWKIGFDERYSYYSPGNLLMLEVIKNAFETEGIDRIDFVTDQIWHRNWTTSKDAYCDAWFYRKRALPILFGAVPRHVAVRLRRVARRVKRMTSK